MLRSISAVGFVVSLICCFAGQAQATYCDWVGPGGRAIYRCGLMRDSDVAQRQVKHEPQRHCDWVGPGGRAVYLCR